MSTVSYAVQQLDRAVTSINNSRSRLVECKMQLAKARKQMMHICKMICPEPINGGYGEFSMHYLVDAEYCKPTIRVYMNNLDGFKNTKLEAMLWFLGTLDGGRDVKSHEYAQSLNRDYRFVFEEFDVVIHAYVRDDSPTCRKVIVDTKMVKQEVYAIQCD
jgi:hypothetical protein